MLPNVLRPAAKLLAVLAIAGAMPLAAHAGQPNVNWSVTIGSNSPGPVYVSPAPVYVQPQPVYVSPRPVYVQPRPVYVQPRPVYVQPGTVVQIGGPQFGYRSDPPRGHWKHHDRRGHGHHHHHRHDGRR